MRLYPTKLCLEVDRVPWKAVMKESSKAGHSSKKSLKDAGAGHPHVLKEELVGKKTGLAEQGVFTGTQDKKKDKEGAGNPEEHKDVIRSCRKKIIRQKLS